MRRQAVAANRDHALALQLSGHPPGRPAPVPIGATLIVSPVSIVHEWAKEIARHALGLRVFMYAGRKSNMLPEDTHQRGGCGVPPAPPPSAQCSYCWCARSCADQQARCGKDHCGASAAAPARGGSAAAASSVATLPSAPRLVFGGEGALAWHRLAERG